MNERIIFRWSPYYYERVEDISLGQNKLDFLSINLPALCNYNCSFCFAADSLNKIQNTSRKIIPINDILTIIKDARKHWLKHIEISWEWEPSLPIFRPYLQDIVKTATEIGIHVTLFTNGSLIDKSFLKFLSEHNTSLIVSIKYFDANKYNKNVGRNMFDFILRNIRLINDKFSNIKIVNWYRVHNFGLFSGVFDDNENDNAMLRKYCDENNIFFSLSTQIPQWKLSAVQTDYSNQDAIVDKYQHNSIILANNSKSEIWFSVCWTFYYGIWLNCYGDRLFDAHAAITIGKTDNLSLLQALEKQKKIIHILFTQYNCQSYCPLRDVNYQSFLQQHLLDNSSQWIHQ